MKDEAIRLKWEEFVNDATYKEHFMSGDEAWYDTLSKVKAYMDEHKSRPFKSKDKAIKTLGMDCTIRNYKKKSDYER